MFSILKALIRIAKNLQEIRDILSIAHHDAIERYKLEQLYKKEPKKDKEVEFVAKEIEDEDQILEQQLLETKKEEEFTW